jgi:hypothetical protein
MSPVPILNQMDPIHAFLYILQDRFQILSSPISLRTSDDLLSSGSQLTFWVPLSSLPPTQHERVISPLLSVSLIHSSMDLQPFVWPWPLLQIRNLFFTKTVGLLGRVTTPLHGRYLYRGQQEHRINAHTNIHALSRIPTHDPRVWTSEDSSCLRPRGDCDPLYLCHHNKICVSTICDVSQCAIFSSLVSLCFLLSNVL